MPKYWLTRISNHGPYALTMSIWLNADSKPQTFLFKVALNLTLCYMLNNSSAREMVLSCRTLQRNYFKRDSNVANFSLTLLLYGDVFGG